MKNPHDERYNQAGYYWRTRPSEICFRVLRLLPPERPLKLLDIGFGEGRNAVFFARNGYRVTAFDSSPKGVEKTKQTAEQAGVKIDVFEADINQFRLTENFDILFSTGVLQYVPPGLRPDLFQNYHKFTSPAGLNVFSVFVSKPFIARAPDAEETAHLWISGEILTYSRDWRIEFCTEEIFDCMSSGVPHQHAINRIIARKESLVSEGK
jgi:tellurite methyltransferase